MDNKAFHSVTLNEDKCKGCTTCIKVCPTEAIRVRNGKAKIIKERCIDCGQCIRACPHRAKSVFCDSFDALEKFKYNVALTAPALYGQFHNLEDSGYVLTGLTKIGFDAVFEVAATAEIISDHTRNLFKEGVNIPRPIISSACPACVRLIITRFPHLISHILPLAAPVELAAILARNEAVTETGISPEDIGVFFITPCPAKVTALRDPIGFGMKVLDGAIAISDAYLRLVPAMNKLEAPEIYPTAGLIGIGWGVSGGEGNALLNKQYLAVDGIQNVIQILEDLEDEKLPELDFIELNACIQGCVGGCLNVENPFVAKTRIRSLMKYLPVSKNKSYDIEGIDGLNWHMQPEYSPGMQLGSNLTMTEAMERMQRINDLTEKLPGLDCGSCGAPSCRALAEDIVATGASEDDCIFRMQERMAYLSGMGENDSYLPPPFRQRKSHVAKGVEEGHDNAHK